MRFEQVVFTTHSKRTHYWEAGHFLLPKRMACQQAYSKRLETRLRIRPGEAEPATRTGFLITVLMLVFSLTCQSEADWFAGDRSQRALASSALGETCLKNCSLDTGIRQSPVCQ